MRLILNDKPGTRPGALIGNIIWVTLPLALVPLDKQTLPTDPPIRAEGVPA